MDVIISFIQSIVTSLGTIVDIFISAIEDAVYIAELGFSFILKVPDILGFLPLSVVGMFGVGFMVSLLFIVGRFL